MKLLIVFIGENQRYRNVPGQVGYDEHPKLGVVVTKSSEFKE